MRVPAISFDPPVGAPGGISPLHSAYAASRTAVSPDGRGSGRARSRREPEPSQAPAPRPQPAPVTAGEDAEPLPVYYPPLLAQRAVLDRPAPAPTAAPAEAYDVPLTSSWPGALAPDADSALEQHLRRVMGVGPEPSGG